MTRCKLLLATATLVLASCRHTAPLPTNAVVAPSDYAYVPSAPAKTAGLNGAP